MSPGQTLRSWRTSISFLARLSRFSLHSRLTIGTLGSGESYGTDGTRVASGPRCSSGSWRSGGPFGSRFTLFATGSGGSYGAEGSGSSSCAVVARCTF